jgi:hypothetical protein
MLPTGSIYFFVIFRPNQENAKETYPTQRQNLRLFVLGSVGGYRFYRFSGGTKDKTNPTNDRVGFVFMNSPYKIRLFL